MKFCIVADRGFGDHKLYQVLTEELKFDYVIRPEVTERGAGTHKRNMQRNAGAISNENNKLQNSNRWTIVVLPPT